MIRPGDRVTVIAHAVSIIAGKPPLLVAARSGVVRDVGDRFATVDYDDADPWGYMVELALLRPYQALAFVDALNDTAVTFVRELSGWGWSGVTGPGFEVSLYRTGEIRAFSTYAEAHAWRVAECLAWVA